MIAGLREKGHSYRQIGRLTYRQIAEIENHPRDKQGKIKQPDDPGAEAPKAATLTDELAAVDRLAAVLSAMGSKIDAEAMKAKLAAKYAEGKNDGR
jgi:hypothetical protein